MPDTSHTGFEPWKITDPAFPYPVGEIDLSFSDPGSAGIHCEMVVPNAIPDDKSVAERSIGIKDSFKFWVALECSKGKGGIVSCEAVLRCRHMGWFPHHGEHGPGELMEYRLGAADLAGNGFLQQLDDHGHHCDLFSINWGQAKKGVYLSLNGFHFQETPAEFRRAQAEARKRTQEEQLLPAPKLRPLPAYDWDKYPPKPKPRPEDGNP